MKNVLIIICLFWSMLSFAQSSKYFNNIEQSKEYTKLEHLQIFDKLDRTQDFENFFMIWSNLLKDVSQGLDYRYVSEKDYETIKVTYNQSSTHFNAYLRLFSDIISDNYPKHISKSLLIDSLRKTLDSALLSYQVIFNTVFYSVKYGENKYKSLETIIFKADTTGELLNLIDSIQPVLRSKIDSSFLVFRLPCWHSIVTFNHNEITYPENLQARQSVISLYQKTGTYEQKMYLNFVRYPRSKFTWNHDGELETIEKYKVGTEYKIKLDTRLYTLAFKINTVNNSIEQIYPYNADLANKMNYLKGDTAKNGTLYTYEPMGDIYIPAPNENNDINNVNYLKTNKDNWNNYIFILFSNHQFCNIESIYEEILKQDGKCYERFRKFLVNNSTELNMVTPCTDGPEGFALISEFIKDGKYTTHVSIHIK